MVALMTVRSATAVLLAACGGLAARDTTSLWHNLDPVAEGVSPTLAGIFFMVNGTKGRDHFLQTNQDVLDRSHAQPFYATFPKDMPDFRLWSTGASNFTDPTDDHNEKAKHIWVTYVRLLSEIAEKSSLGTTEDDRPYLLLEDDATLVPDWEARLRDTLARTPSGTDVVLMSYWGSRHCSDAMPNSMFEVKNERSLWHHRNFAYYSGLQASVVTPASARKIVALAKVAPMQNFDRFLLSKAVEGRVKELAVPRELIIAHDMQPLLSPPFSRWWSCSSYLPF